MDVILYVLLTSAVTFPFEGVARKPTLSARGLSKTQYQSKSIGFKSLSVKFNDIFLSTEWLQRNFIYFAMILPLDFSEIFDIFRIKVLFFFFENSRKMFKKIFEPS